LTFVLNPEILEVDMEKASEPTSSPSVSSAPHSPKLNILTLFLVALLFLTLGLAGGYLLASNTLLKESSKNIRTTSLPTQTPKTTSPATARKTTFFGKTYFITYPITWKQQVTEDTASQILTLTKNDYVIKITYAGMDGGKCVFNGELTGGPEDDLRTAKYVEIKSADVIRRRVENKSMNTDANRTTFFFCNSTDKNFFSNTGFLRYETPRTYDEKMLEEMDSIVKTLTTITPRTYIHSSLRFSMIFPEGWNMPPSIIDTSNYPETPPGLQWSKTKPDGQTPPLIIARDLLYTNDMPFEEKSNRECHWLSESKNYKIKHIKIDGYEAIQYEGISNDDIVGKDVYYTCITVNVPNNAIVLGWHDISETPSKDLQDLLSSITFF
jgi:hypothetical protein